jgi:hypothetical protein
MKRTGNRLCLARPTPFPSHARPYSRRAAFWTIRGGERPAEVEVLSTGRMRTRGLLVALSVLPVLAVASAAGAQSTGIPARVVVISPPVSTATYPGVDYGRKASPRDDRAMTTSWRVVEETGNCCETYLTTTPGGRLLDFGGRYIYFSDDRGVTWRRVEPLVPLLNGEGAIVAAPGGDVLGVEWDPYSGDHLQFYKFEADTQQWLYTEMPVHQPFYDREWIAVLPGPVTIDGQTHEYVSFVKGGIPKEVWFYSTDGLNYTQVTSKDVDRFLSGIETQAPLPTAARADSDWVQPNTNSGMTQLGAGDLLASPDFFAGWSLLEGETFTWSSYRLPDGSDPEGTFQVDSAGRVHNVILSGDRAAFDYRTSDDGGRTWKTITVRLPKHHNVNEIDFRANRAAGVAAVAMRAHNAVDGTDQDLVYKFGISGAGPRLLRLHEVGLGDVGAVAGVGNPVRFDFESVTIFPDGRVAVSFIDSTTTMHHPVHGTEGPAPAMAIELSTTLGPRIPPPPPEVPPVLGTPYATYTFDEGAEGWTAGGFPTWLRGAPGTKTGQDDPSTASFGIEGPGQYVDNMNASLTSPPIATDPGQTVLEFWLKADIEDGFDFVRAEWSGDGANWVPISQFTGQNEGYPGWEKVTLGFDSPGGNVQVRFRFTSDLLCSGTDPACGTLYAGARVDEVVVGTQAP